MRSLVLALAVLSFPALALSEQRVSQVEADLDADGAAEIYTLLDYGPEGVDLTAESDRGFQTVERVAWSGGAPGQQPLLEVTEAGSLRLTSMNASVGRDRWSLAVTIAHRNGDWRVAGLTYTWWDTLDPAAGGTCDVNLLSGRGILETAGTTHTIEAPWPAPRLWDWRDEYFEPSEVCGL